MLTALRTRFRMVRLLAIAVCTVWLVVILPSSSWAQFGFPSHASSSAAPTTIRNDSYAPYECGRLLCSKVYLYGGDRFPTLTLAEAPKINPDNGQVLPSLLAQRSQWLQDEFAQLVAVLNYDRKHQQWGVNPAQPPRPRAPLPLEELARLSHIDHELVPKIVSNRVPLNPHDLHPDTPNIVISTLNQQTVLMVPAQLNLTEQLLLTVTAADAHHNEHSIEELAVVWRDLIRLTLSTAIAEAELLDSYAVPWLGPKIATWLGIMFVVLVIGGWLRAGCRWWERRLRRHLRDLQRNWAADSELDAQPVNPDLDATTAGFDVTHAEAADTGIPNASTPNASTPNASTPNASTPNASTPNASTPNASTPNVDATRADAKHGTDHRSGMVQPSAVAASTHSQRVNKLGTAPFLDQGRSGAVNSQAVSKGQKSGWGQEPPGGMDQPLRQTGGAVEETGNPRSPRPAPLSSAPWWGRGWRQGWGWGQRHSQILSHQLGQQMHEWVRAISHRTLLHRQGWLSQQRNLAQLLALVLRWFQIWVILYGIGEMIFLFPGLRLYSHLLIPVAIRIPILWMVIGFVDKTVDFICDAALNRWAWRSALNNSSSQRYPLRVSTYSPAIHGATTFVANCIGGYFTIRMLNINPAGLASIGAVAVAATFLSRNLIEGILNGVLILWTDRYAVGDAVEIQGEVGIVEDMNLYLTVVRGREGRAIAIPNGQITTVANLSKDWSRVDLRVAIDHEADVEVAKAIIMDVSAQLHADPDWAEKVIDPAIIMGVDDLSHFGVTLLIWMKTQPLQHWAVGREFRLRLKQAFAEHNITLAMPRQAVYYQSSPFPAGMTGGDAAGINTLDVD